MEKITILISGPYETKGTHNGNLWVLIPSPCESIPARWYKVDDPEIWRTEEAVTVRTRIAY